MAAGSVNAKGTPEVQLRSLIEKFDPRDQRLILQLAHPDVEALIAAAMDQAGVPLPSSGSGTLVIKSTAAMKRPRRKPAK